jgi:regulator of protease activity HflC (stomatin/prohibitin superfamily)
MTDKTTKKIIIGVVIFILILIFNPFYKISTEERGLLLTWGNLSNDVIQPGLHLKVPFIQKVKRITIRPIQLDEDVAVSEQGAITKDNQTIGSTMTIFYKFKLDQLPAMYSLYGTGKINDIITQTLKESFKAEIGNYTIFELATVQDEVRNNVFARLQEKMVQYPIDVTELKITNYDWSDDFDAQIKETMNRSQQVKQKEQELLITQQEAQKKVKEAEADKQAMITRAEGEKEQARLQADAKALEGEGVKKYNQSVAINWDIELRKMELAIEKIKAEKWNGAYVSTNNYTPIPIQNGSLLGK